MTVKMTVKETVIGEPGRSAKASAFVGRLVENLLEKNPLRLLGTLAGSLLRLFRRNPVRPSASLHRVKLESFRCTQVPGNHPADGPRGPRRHARLGGKEVCHG
jgi:hypothetical protein